MKIRCSLSKIVFAFENSVQIVYAFQIVFAFENSVHDFQWIIYSLVFALMSVMREIEDYVLDSHGPIALTSAYYKFVEKFRAALLAQQHF